MKLAGLLKTSLVDYTPKLASTVFTQGCNMRCPFCHNKTLVIDSDCKELITPQEIISFFESRKHILEGVCITGGEATEQPDLESFIRSIKDLGLSVKLDTNGLNYDHLYKILSQNLVDYIAMDIKNSLEKYPLTTGLKNMNINSIKQSASLIMNSGIDYEFRTTVVREFHQEEDFIKISHWLKGSKKYCLQKYEYNDQQLSNTPYTSYTKEEIIKIQNLLTPYFFNICIKGYE